MSYSAFNQKLRAFLLSVARDIQLETADRLTAGIQQDGEPMSPLNPMYKQWKIDHGYPGDFGVLTGDMLNGILSPKALRYHASTGRKATVELTFAQSTRQRQKLELFTHGYMQSVTPAQSGLLRSMFAEYFETLSEPKSRPFRTGAILFQPPRPFIRASSRTFRRRSKEFKNMTVSLIVKALKSPVSRLGL
ncbi:MAG: hypothetical protein KatS3mg087_1301 [Patescibacteria group bacterium]|nr:MAG: hypothetical protein KatS3mg087_1301 [Patescibacteria group bacterium]